MPETTDQISPRAITPWTNGLGFNVRVRGGEAIIADCADRLGVSVPVTPREEWSTRVNRWITINRRRTCSVPLGTGIAEAIATCKRDGKLIDID